MKKRLFITLLMVALFACIFAISISAAEFGKITYVDSMTTVEGLDTTSRVLMNDGITYPSAYIFKDLKNTSFTALSDATGKQYSASSVVMLEYPEGCTYSDGAFSGSTTLEYVYFSSTVSSFRWAAFGNCTNLAEIIFAENSTVTEINTDAFHDTAITTLKLPNSLETVNDNFIRNCKNLHTVYFGENFKKAFNSTAFFSGCPIKTIYAPAGVFNDDGTISLNCKFFGWNDKDNKTMTSGGVIYYTGTQAQAETIIATQKGLYQSTYTRESDYNTAVWWVIKAVSLDEYNALSDDDRANNCYMVYGYNKCDAFYNGIHTEKNEDNNPCWLTECSVCSLANAYCGNENTHNVSYKIAYSDYTANGSKLACCSNENCEYQNVVVDNTLEPLFVYLGYSANMGGTKITVGYKVNQEALKAYEESTGKTLSYGVVACVADGEQNTPISVENGELSVSEKVVKAELMGGYAGFDFILTGFTSDYYNTALVMCAYIYDGDRVCYINKGGCDAFATSVTFSSEVNE